MSNNTLIKRILIFGDDYGVPQLHLHIPEDVEDIRCVASSQRDIPKYFYPDYIQPHYKEDEFPEFVKDIKEYSPDLIVVNSYSMYIPDEIIKLAKYGGINIHYSLLPKFRGPNPIQWAIIKGEMRTGVTIHYLNNRIDAGDIITQDGQPIYCSDTWIKVRDRCYITADNLLDEVLPKLIKFGKAASKRQIETHASQYPRRTKEDGKFEWSEPAVDIFNKIRALVKPLDGAFYYDTHGKKVVINEYKELDWVKDQKARLFGQA